MDVDLHFGRFFGPKIDVFEKFLLPDFELQPEIRSAKIVILPRENAVFYKIDILALKWQPMKNIKKNRKNITSKSSCFFTLIFLGFWSQLGLQNRSKIDQNGFQHMIKQKTQNLQKPLVFTIFLKPWPLQDELEIDQN